MYYTFASYLHYIQCMHVHVKQSFMETCTVHAAKCYDQSRLILWNFESHMTFLRGFCVDITRKYGEFCVERGDRT